MTRMIKNYTELSRLRTFKERYEYLKLDSKVGEETFGFDRYLNQILYTSPEWRWVRNRVIVRDNGCDLGLYGYDIFSRVTIHHINPITVDDIKQRRESVIFNLENLITTTDITHKAIHYGSEDAPIQEPIVRRPNDTCPWRQ